MISSKVRILSTIVSVFMVLSVQACQPNRNQTSPSTPSVTTEVTSPETTPVETTIESTPAETIKETTAPIETTTAPTETTAETTPVETTAAPTTATTTAPTETTASQTETPMVKTVYATGNVNIRSGPGSNYSKIKTVPAGTALSVVALTANNWYRLEDNTYVSPSVVSDTLPTPTPTPTPSPTPDPNAPTPTPAEVGISQSEAKGIAKDVITSIRSANGFTTNYSDVLSGACQAAANRYIVEHTATNGSLESIAGVGQGGYDSRTGFTYWSCSAHDGTKMKFTTSEEAISWVVKELIVNHVPRMASDSTFTEFGVGIAKEVKGAEWMWQVQYYVYISCATPEGLQNQIDMGWYS